MMLLKNVRMLVLVTVSAFLLMACACPLMMAGGGGGCMSHGDMDHSQPQKPAPEYVCPDHPDVKATFETKCPKCAKDLAKPAPAGKDEYTCPMHPDVKANFQANCPKCGMKMEKKK